MRTFFFLLMLVSFSGVFAQEEVYVNDALAYQRAMKEKFADPMKSPFLPEEQKKFRGLDFFPVDTGYRVEANLVLTPESIPFEMTTTTDRRPIYKKYADAYFTLKGKEYRLSVYQNVDLMTKEGFEDYLFVPFTDLTNDNETYAVGRYLDAKLPKEGEPFIIDFNKSYNPYCAYSDLYSCPIPPEENALPVAIYAGIKNYKKGTR